MMKPGLIALIGSGETAAAGGQAFEALADKLGAPLPISVLETPAGFELNSATVAGRVAEYMKTRLQNYRPDPRLIPARSRASEFSPDNPAVLEPLLESRFIFAGPGSPSYAVRQLQGSLAWEYVQARHRLGAALAFASAASISVGALSLPVYEIYKVGEDPHWKPGLDLFDPYGLSLAIIPHWNNTDGGAELDTSHCFIGANRYEKLRAALPSQTSILGIDEHTSLIIDLDAGVCQVIGRDEVHIYCDGGECAYHQGEQFPISALGDYHPLEKPDAGIRPQVWQTVTEAHRIRQETAQAVSIPPDEVHQLVALRQEARSRRDWAESDRLRDQIAARGWAVKDTPSGPVIEPNP
ncbi:MAG TPA: hypothetical protein PJ988_05000 [Anaerolinea sp.]|nr:hypothetical protein [Anaerolinea sp.]